MYKLIAIDMDGTLLNDQKKISKEDLDSLRKCLNKGCKVILSSGRPIQGVRKYKELDFINLPIIAYNGAVIIDDNKIVFENSLLTSDAKKIFDFGISNNMTMCIWANNNLYSNKIDKWSLDYITYNDAKINLIKDFNEIKGNIIKFVFYDTQQVIDNFKLEFNQLEFESARGVKTSLQLFEVFNKNVSKAKALEFLIDKYKIDIKDTISIGDGDNDIEMLDFTGLKVAMDNASELVKKHSNYLTLSNNDNGVSKVINEFILKE